MECKDCEFWDDGCFLPEWEECENRPSDHSDCAGCGLASVCSRTEAVKK